ncbi:MAG: IS982 family transposase [Chloroflexota bacterium]
MTSINIETLLTIIYVWVDDWYQSEGQEYLRGKVGRKPTFSDSDVITLMLAQEYILYPAERQFLSYVRANHLSLFPDLLSQSQYNRRARQLRYLVEAMRRTWLAEMGVLEDEYYLMDTKPMPVMGYKRLKGHSQFLDHADYGYCVSRRLYYFGYKLVMVSTLDGIPIVYDLVAANTDERQAIETLLDAFTGVTLIGDKGFIGTDWQAQVEYDTHSIVYTPKRKNQLQQQDKAFEKWLNQTREWIEGVFHELQNTGRFLERLLAKTVQGLASRND